MLYRSTALPHSALDTCPFSDPVRHGGYSFRSGSGKVLGTDTVTVVLYISDHVVVVVSDLSDMVVVALYPILVIEGGGGAGGGGAGGVEQVAVEQ
ncbi:hypothetical protein Tco_0863896 [Tanacetum coccineum]